MRSWGMSDIFTATERTARTAGAPPAIPQAASRFAAAMDIHVDARDVQRGILNVRESLHLPYSGQLTVRYPEWLPGYHAPEAPLELLAGLRFSCNGEAVTWRRDPVTVHAF